jgi:hypothetical protein
VHQPLQPGGRPTGITILAVVAALGGILNVVVSLDPLGVGGAAPAGHGVSGLTTVVGLVLVIIGVVLLVLAYGYWMLKPWAWTLGVGTWIVVLVSSVLQYMNDNTLLVAMIVSAVIPLVILYYLFRPRAKAAFGRT